MPDGITWDEIAAKSGHALTREDLKLNTPYYQIFPPLEAGETARLTGALRLNPATKHSTDIKIVPMCVGEDLRVQDHGAAWTSLVRDQDFDAVFWTHRGNLAAEADHLALDAYNPDALVKCAKPWPFVLVRRSAVLILGDSVRRDTLIEPCSWDAFQAGWLDRCSGWAATELPIQTPQEWMEPFIRSLDPDKRQRALERLTVS